MKSVCGVCQSVNENNVVMCTTFIQSNMSIRYTYPSNTIQSGEFTIFVEDVAHFIQNICKINIRRNRSSSFYNNAFKI